MLHTLVAGKQKGTLSKLDYQEKTLAEIQREFRQTNFMVNFEGGFLVIFGGLACRWLHIECVLTTSCAILATQVRQIGKTQINIGAGAVEVYNRAAEAPVQTMALVVAAATSCNMSHSYLIHSTTLNPEEHSVKQAVLLREMQTLVPCNGRES